MSLQHVSPTARPSRLCVPFSKKLDSLIDRLDNQHMMYDSRNGALEWVRGNRKDTYYYIRAMLRWL
jgi:hypothetical protein